MHNARHTSFRCARRVGPLAVALRDRQRPGIVGAILIAALGLQLTSCGDDTTPNSARSFDVGGTVTGLTGDIVLVNNEFDALTVSANGPFKFRLTSNGGSPYSVVLTAEPGDQVCKLSNGNGVIGGTDITDIQVACTTTGEKPLYAFTGGPDGSFPNSGLSEGTDGNFYGTTSTGGVNDRGTVFRVTPTGVHTVLYSFTSAPTDGQNPESGLELGADGAFYATTSAGGAYGGGTFFRITQNGAHTLLFSFGGNGSGRNPQGLTLLDDGNFYGTTTEGGANNLGTVFRISASGVHTILHSFSASAGHSPVAGLSPSADDRHLFGVTNFGGTNDVGTIFRIARDGSGYTTLYSFGAGPTDGAYPGVKLRRLPDGSQYGSTGSGGTAGFGTIFRYDPVSGETKVVHSFTGAPDGGSFPSSRLRIGHDGNLYGVTYYGGSFDAGTFFRMTPAGDLTLLYNFSGGEGGSRPNSSLLLSDTGDFYGTTVTGGKAFAGTIYKIRP